MEPHRIGQLHRHQRAPHSFHRTDGPAITNPDGTLEWWVNGNRKPPEVEAILTMMWHQGVPIDLTRTP
jgi:hypothetical protein